MNKSSSKVTITEYSGGVESWLDAAFWCAVLLGTLSGAAMIIMAFSGSPFSGILFGAGTATIIGACISGLVCKALAEVIRLLKRLNGLKYGGQLREAREGWTFHRCSQCGFDLHEDAPKCSSCGAVFEGMAAEK